MSRRSRSGEERFSQEYGHMFSSDEKDEKKGIEDKKEEGSPSLPTLKPAEGIAQELKKESFILVAANGCENLMQVVEHEGLQCRLLKPVSKNDTGPGRSFARLYFDRRDQKFWISNQLSAKVKPHCDEVIEWVPMDRILYSFAKLDRRSIPAEVYANFEKLYGRAPVFKQQV